MTQVEQMLSDGWIERCPGLWGLMIVLAQKSHQEHIDNIDDFMWCMCVSYRKLKGVTKSFQFSIPRWDDAITDQSWGTREIWIVNLGSCQGYHQVAVRKIDREKLAFFGPRQYKVLL